MVKKYNQLENEKLFPVYQSIFSDEIKEYIKFECNTKNIDQKLLYKRNGFGVQNTEIFPKYLNRRNYENVLKNYVRNGDNVIIQGLPDVGKTRLVYEVLRSNEIKNYYVFSFSVKYWPQLKSLKFSNNAYKMKLKLIWFIDDLHYFHEDTQEMYDKLINIFGDISVIATLRSDRHLQDEPFLYTMKRIEIDEWKQEELDALSELNSVTIRHSIGNTPSWIINDFHKLKNIYLLYKNEGNEDCFYLLHYLKVMFEIFDELSPSSLETIFLFLRGELSNKNRFRKALMQLCKANFIEIKGIDILIKDVIFSNIIPDEDTVSIIGDVEKLIDHFVVKKNDSRFYYLGNFFGKRGGHKIALDLFNKAISENPNDSNHYNNRANVFREKKEYNLAIEDYSRAIDLDPMNDCTYANRATVYHMMGNRKKAITDFSTALKINSKNKDSPISLGNIYCEMQNFDLAIKYYTYANEIDPTYINVYPLRAYAYLQSGEYRKAILDYSKYIELNPIDNNGYYMRGVIYRISKKYDLAIEDFNKAIELDKFNVEAYYSRAKIYIKKFLLDLALQDLSKVIKLNPDHVIAVYNRGVLYAKMSEYDLAYEDFNTAIKLDPDYLLAYLNRGKIYWRRGAFDKVIYDYSKVLKSDPKNIDALNIRGNAYYKLMDYKSALEDFTKAIQIDPEYSSAYYNRSSIYAIENCKKKMIKDLRMAIKLDRSLKQKVIEDINFKQYWNDNDFIALTI